MRKELRRAMFRQRPVRVVVGPDTLSGYPVGIGRKWLLLHALDEGMNFDGYSAVRLSAVSGLDLPDDTLPRRVLQSRGQWPPRPPVPVFPLDRTTDLVLAAAAAYPLIAIECHEQDPGLRFVGVPLGVEERHLRLHQLKHDLTWQPGPVRWWLRNVTLVEVGGAYERALWEAVGPDPLPGTGTSR